MPIRIPLAVRLAIVAAIIFVAFTLLGSFILLGLTGLFRAVPHPFWAWWLFLFASRRRQEYAALALDQRHARYSCPLDRCWRDALPLEALSGLEPAAQPGADARGAGANPRRNRQLRSRAMDDDR